MAALTSTVRALLIRDCLRTVECLTSQVALSEEEIPEFAKGSKTGVDRRKAADGRLNRGFQSAAWKTRKHPEPRTLAFVSTVRTDTGTPPALASLGRKGGVPTGLHHISPGHSGP